MDETEQALTAQAVARDAIRHTMSVYNNAGDRGDFDSFVGCFTPDGTLEVFGRRYQGHEEIRGFATSTAAPRREAAAAPAAKGKPFSRHHTTTCRVEVTSPTTASGWTYYIFFSNDGPPSSGLYIDSFVKTGGRWLIAARRVKIDGE